MTSSAFRNPAGKWLAAAFLLLAAGIGVLWYSANSAYEAAVLRERGRELQAIAELKIDFIRLWLDEHRGAAVVQAGRLMMARSLVPRAGSAGSYGPEDVRGQLEAIRQAYRYKAVALLERDGSIRLGAGPLGDFGRRAMAAAARAAIAGRQVQVVRAYRLEEGSRNHIDIDIAAPVVDNRQPGAPIVGALAFHLDSRMHLDPLLYRWPAPGGSGESFLIERAGEELIYLTSLRHAEAATLRKRIAEPALPAAMAAKGNKGGVEGIDYRGVPVLAAVGRVPDMPWYVVAKLDREEILAPVRRQALWSGALSVLLVLALGLAMRSWQRRSQSELALAQQIASREALRASEARARKLAEYSWDYQLLYDRNMKIVYASPSVTRDLGHDLVGRNIADGRATVHPEDIDKVEAARRSALSQPGLPQRIDHRLGRGDGIWMEVEAYFVNHFDDPDICALSYVARDISGRIKAERTRQESEERYRFLFQLSPDAVFVHRDNRILFANDAAARLFNAGSAQAMIGLDWHGLVVREGWPEIERRIATLMSGEQTFLQPSEQRYLTLDSQAFQVEATAARILIEGRPAIMSVVRDITGRRQAEAQRLEHLRQQRDTLVREVHHRIKNHLQGLAGLLNQHRRKYPENSDALEAVSAQIAAISVIHGLQSREASGEVRVFKLLKEIVAFLGSRAELEFGNAGNPVCHDCPWRLADDESVPVALVINELVTNAIKHQVRPAEGPPAPLRIDCACNSESLVATVRNPGALPQEFDFAAGSALGTGLTLVRSLLSQEGAALSIAAAGGTVESRLTLAPPVASRKPDSQLASRR